MIIRFVKMTFVPGKEKDFQEVFEQSKQDIRSFEGCVFLELLQDKDNRNVFFTHSHWINENSLNAYRNSELFKQTWAKTKVLFHEKPQVWSLNVASMTNS
jgi:quinol monooxygenase YgiN